MTESEQQLLAALDLALAEGDDEDRLQAALFIIELADGTPEGIDAEIRSKELSRRWCDRPERCPRS